MKKYTCTCLKDDNDKKCLVHKKKMYRNFWKRDDEIYEFAEEDDIE